MKEEDQLNRWTEHFKEILNRPDPEEGAVPVLPVPAPLKVVLLGGDGDPDDERSSLDTEISTRIGKAAAVMAKLSKRVWCKNQLTENTKVQVYQAYSLSPLLYGIES
nr:hypothetical protein BaRGS_012519 [Batillaria attramentaria]